MIRHCGAGTAIALAATLLGTSACASHAPAYDLPAATASLVQVEVYDRNDGAALPVYSSGARRYIVGTPGHEYALRIRNRTGARVLAVTSVDGVNVISGDTAAPSQSGYVLDPYGFVEILGWRKSLERTAAFFFTDVRNSYAARTGRPEDVGVIGVAVFREKAKPIARRDLEPLPAPLARSGPFGSAAHPPAAQAESRTAESAAEASPPLDASAERSGPFAPPAPRALSKLGTGHGRSEPSRVQVVTFERASGAPAETVVVHYDRRENLIAMGVIPAPPATYSQRDPDPFPGAMRFAPDPGPRAR